MAAYVCAFSADYKPWQQVTVLPASCKCPTAANREEMAPENASERQEYSILGTCS